MLTHPRQELYRLGILYDHEKDIAQDSLDESSTNTASCNVLSTICPLFVIRPGRPKRSPRHFRSSSAWRSLPLYLSFSGLSEDAEIARLLSPEPSIPPSIPSSTIQHRPSFPINKFPTPVPPQSLPPQQALELPSLLFIDNNSEWTFITTPTTNTQTSQPSTPLSEPEAWILLSDDS